ncbi:MAG: replicative DNA helicase [Desulfovibrionaceae bacterium]|nr:replicative DNA helicase [Desulfovibrionaceae bacterium]
MPDSYSPNTVPARRPRPDRKPPLSTADKVEKTGKELLARVPPHSVEAEQAVFGGLLSRSGLMSSLASIVGPDDFYLPAHQIIFRACMELDRKSAPVDLIAVTEELRRLGQLEAAGGTIYLGEISNAVVSGANAEYYAGIVREHAIRRGMIDACSDIIGDCFAPGQDFDELVASSEQRLFRVSQRTTGKDFSGSSELVEQVFEHLTDMADSNDEITGVTTGYERLNKLTAGLQKSDLIIVAARPSMGKTAFAMCLALNAAISQDVPVAVFSLEMSKEQLMQRMLAVRAKVDVSKLRRPAMLRDEDWQNLGEAADVIRQAPIYIDDTAALSTLELRARCRRLKAEKGLGLVIVDYLQLMRSGHRVDSRELEISEISRALKGLAKEMDVPVVALSQLNRKVEERGDKRPMLSDLRESGAIEQDADMIMFVYREDVYKHAKPADRPPKGVAEIIIGKQRNGPVGVAELMYISPYTSFEDMAPGYLGSEDQQ